LTHSLALKPNVLFVNRIICYIGKVSFSCYIFHFVVIRIVRQLLRAGYLPFFFELSAVMKLIIFYLITVGITVLFAFISYRYIEEPGIKLGRRIIRRMEGQAG